MRGTNRTRAVKSLDAAADDCALFLGLATAAAAVLSVATEGGMGCALRVDLRMGRAATVWVLGGVEAIFDVWVAVDATSFDEAADDSALTTDASAAALFPGLATAAAVLSVATEGGMGCALRGDLRMGRAATVWVGGV